jgi:hypothetical protein
MSRYHFTACSAFKARWSFETFFENGFLETLAPRSGPALDQLLAKFGATQNDDLDRLIEASKQMLAGLSEPYREEHATNKFVTVRSNGRSSLRSKHLVSGQGSSGSRKCRVFTRDGLPAASPDASRILVWSIAPCAPPGNRPLRAGALSRRRFAVRALDVERPIKGI